MSAENETARIVEAWLKGTSDSPYETGLGVERVRSRVRQTGQHRRWWPLQSVPRATGVPGKTVPAFSIGSSSL